MKMQLPPFVIPERDDVANPESIPQVGVMDSGPGPSGQPGMPATIDDNA